MSGSLHRLLSKKDVFNRRKDAPGSKLKSDATNAEDDPSSAALLQAWKQFTYEPTEAEINAFYNRQHKQQLQKLDSRVKDAGISYLGKPHYRYALRSKFANGDLDKAFEFIIIIQESIDGVLRTYRPSTRLLGAVNRENVTCYLDSLLFAMFARLDFYDGVLHNTFEDEPRRNLVTLLRLWVNLLRSGKLIATDVTKQLQEALAECGWSEASKIRQQDASEAFSFITEKLDLPLMTLKIDIFHTGKEDAGGDHKFVNERLLEVAIPSPNDGSEVTLEACLEAYFNNRVEVKRFLERRNQSLSHAQSIDSMSKEYTNHLELADVDSPSSTSLHLGSSGLTPFPELTEEPSSFVDSSSPNSPTATDEPAPLPETPSSPGTNRPPRARRTSSIVRERFVPDTETVNGSAEDVCLRLKDKYRKGSIRKEIIMPAWQIFSLIPWYTDNISRSDTENTAHFSEKRPILGMCLKRYSILPDGKTVRLNTYVDIPTEIGLPHFIKDDNLEDDAPLYGNFKLALQAVVCHRGMSVDSGHYISLVRGTALAHSESSPGDLSVREDSRFNDENYWLRFDDYAEERITLVDIQSALREESPYLLFYQIMPIDADPADITPPPYEESERYSDVLLEKGISADSIGSNPEQALRDLILPPEQSDGVNGNGLSDKEGTKSARKKKSHLALGSYLSRKKSSEPLSATLNGERSLRKGKEKKSIEVSPADAHANGDSEKKDTRPDRECTVM